MIRRCKLSQLDKDKIKSDLLFLAELLKFSKNHKMRIVVSGGYGLDGILKSITRPHNDLDVIIYSKIVRKKAAELLIKFFQSKFTNSDISLSENKFLIGIDVSAMGFVGNFYVVETVHDPLTDINTIRLDNGQTQVNFIERFPMPIKAKLKNILFESQNPNLHLADILFKSKKQKQSKHIQDIKNLKTITDPKKVKYILSQY